MVYMSLRIHYSFSLYGDFRFSNGIMGIQEILKAARPLLSSPGQLDDVITKLSLYNIGKGAR